MKQENKACCALEELDHYLLLKRGVSGIPLAYLVRTDVVPGDDPGYGEPSITEDLIARAPHGPNNVIYTTDNRHLWTIIRNMTQGGFAWVWIAALDRSRNGRQAYINLKTYFLGKAFVGKLKTQADRTLSTTTYTGYKGFTIDDYSAKIKSAFNDLTSDPDPEEISQKRQVEKFLKGIKDSKLDVAKGIIQATDAYAENLDNAITFMSQYEQQRKTSEARGPSRNISEYGTGRGRGRGHGQG